MNSSPTAHPLPSPKDIIHAPHKSALVAVDLRATGPARAQLKSKPTAISQRLGGPLHTTAVRRTHSAWYTRDGHPLPITAAANGEKRPTTLRDARRLGLFPAVAAILDVIARPVLQTWIVAQGILSSITLPRVDDETPDAFARRVAADMNSHRDQAARLGARIHHAIGQTLAGLPPDPEIAAHLVELKKWFAAVNVKPLAIDIDRVSLEWGFGGRIDLYAEVHGQPALIDVRSQDVKKAQPNFYENWPLHLAAHRQILRETGHRVEACYTVIVDAHAGRPIHVRHWTNDDLDFDTFAATFTLWKYLKSYDPLTAAQEAA